MLDLIVLRKKVVSNPHYCTKANPSPNGPDIITNVKGYVVSSVGSMRVGIEFKDEEFLGHAALQIKLVETTRPV